MAHQKVYRIEEIPRNECNLQDDEQLVAVSHFYKDVYNSFGIPFYIKIKQGELFTVVKDRIQKKLGVPDKEYDKVNGMRAFERIMEFILITFFSINLPL